MRERETIKNLLKARLYLEAYLCSLDFAHLHKNKTKEYLYFIAKAYQILNLVKNLTATHRASNSNV